MEVVVRFDVAHKKIFVSNGFCTVEIAFVEKWWIGFSFFLRQHSGGIALAFAGQINSCVFAVGGYILAFCCVS